jgi:transcriptional regulator with XRE-family HTH domain
MNQKELISEFAANLRAERARRKYTQEYLAEKADITADYMTKIELEKYNPSIFVVAKIAVALGVSLDKLIPLDKYIN